MNSLRILGIDPGSRKTGYAVLDVQGTIKKALLCDALNLTKIKDWQPRLCELYSFVSNIIDTYKPDSCAIEVPVYGKDPLAMMKLGRSQASIIMAALHKNVPVFEYYPKAVKKAISGNGNASKVQVAYMLEKILNIDRKILTDDATDALAVAWCHLQKIQAPGSVENGSSPEPVKRKKNTWSSFVADNPDRIRKL
ncbi:crossover junction endodeoxyribonuclease RuvC [Balneolaceae bacterium ANBcel3]|nr:crossover junction endodeoxyribonuclease RuvC [Balneolaceae bacterium ANBcel3]